MPDLVLLTVSQKDLLNQTRLNLDRNLLTK